MRVRVLSIALLVGLVPMASGAQTYVPWIELEDLFVGGFATAPIDAERIAGASVGSSGIRVGSGIRVEVKAAEVKVDGVAEALSVAEATS